MFRKEAEEASGRDDTDELLPCPRSDNSAFVIIIPLLGRAAFLEDEGRDGGLSSDREKPLPSSVMSLQDLEPQGSNARVCSTRGHGVRGVLYELSQLGGHFSL